MSPSPTLTDEQIKLERMIVFSIEVAQEMLEEYEAVIPFGIRAFADSDEIKMQCFQEEHPKANWDELINTTVDELKKSVEQGDIFAIAIVLSVESEDAMGVGLQIDTRKGPALFVYPYHQEEDKWVIDEPSQAEMLIAPRVFS
jgi:hypothetical protein